MFCQIAVALIAIVWLAGPAIAAPRDPDVPKIDARGPWRVMHQTNEKSTSKCIGNPATALCAAETMYACFVRQDIELCRIAMGPDNPPWFKPWAGRSQPEQHERYRIVMARRLRAKGGSDVPYIDIDRSFKGDSLRPGDIMIKMEERSCWISHGKSKCASLNDPHEISAVFYFVRKATSQWIVIDHADAAS